MKKFTSKKINTLILIVFVYVSVKNLLSFNDSEMEIVQQIDNYKTFLLENQFNMHILYYLNTKDLLKTQRVKNLK